jgi:spore coat protein H
MTVARVISTISMWLWLATVSLAAPSPADELFTNASVRRLQLTIPEENIAALRSRPRDSVRAQLREGDTTWRIGIHLKGAVGSFRSIDGKPAFTINLDKAGETNRFHGLRKFHLNNSVEDPTYMHELLGSELFIAAKVPASRVSHAIVEMNGKRLGMYVLKEAFTEEMLGRFFRHPKGNFYDITRDGHDVDEKMDKAFGHGPNDRSDLEAVAAFVHEPDLQQRWQGLQRTLDVDRFLSFMALEFLLVHRDGYCLARNNFRIYQDIEANRLVFVPHGMDQLLGNPRALLEPRMNGAVARALMEIPEARRAYRARYGLLRTNLLDAAAMNRRIDATLPVLSAALRSDEARALEQHVAELRARIAARFAEIDKQLAQPPLELLRFTNNPIALTGWRAVDLPEGGALTELRDGPRTVLTIRAGPVTSASWRTRVLLPPGRYRFEGALTGSGIKPLAFGKNHGATLRVIGVSPGGRSKPVLPGRSWVNTAVEFATSEPEHEVELVCELRASAGEARFDLGSLVLRRLD